MIPRTVRKRDETELLRAIHDGVIASGRAVLWRNNCGQATYGVHRVRYGLGLGSADLIGLIIRPGHPEHGRGVAIEVKTPIGRLSPAQHAWAQVWGRSGGVYILARSVGEALAGLTT